MADEEYVNAENGSPKVSPNGRQKSQESPEEKVPGAKTKYGDPDGAEKSSDEQPLITGTSIEEQQPPERAEDALQKQGTRIPACTPNWFVSCLHSNWVTGGICLFMFFATFLFLFLHFFVLQLMQNHIADGLKLTNSTSEQWAHPKAETYISCYFFNVTNANETDDMVKVREMGPYVYRMKVDRTDIVWFKKNGSVSYKNVYTFHFDPKKSVGTEEDLITTVDIPVLILHSLTGPAAHAIEKILSLKDHTFKTFSVRELLWGYESQVFHKIQTGLKEMDMLHIFNDAISKFPTKFGYFSGTNGTAGPTWNVYTGAIDFCRFNQIHSWNNYRKLPYWSSPLANMIRGTDGSMFSPFIDAETSNLTFFSSHLYRAFDLQFQKSVRVKGVSCYRYIIPDSQFSNTTMSANDSLPKESKACQRHFKDIDHKNVSDNPATPEYSEDTITDNNIDDIIDKIVKEQDDIDKNDKSLFPDITSKAQVDGGGFCVPDCVPDGLYSLETVEHGAPIYVSLPHLLGADHVYFQHIDGLFPNENAHRPTFDIDSVTGAVLSEMRKYQLNVRLPEVFQNGDLGRIVPLFWLNAASLLDDKVAAEVKTAHMTYRAVESLCYFDLGLAAFSWLMIIFLVIARTWCCPKPPRLAPENS